MWWIKVIIAIESPFYTLQDCETLHLFKAARAEETSGMQSLHSILAYRLSAFFRQILLHCLNTLAAEIISTDRVKFEKWLHSNEKKVVGKKMPLLMTYKWATFGNDTPTESWIAVNSSLWLQTLKKALCLFIIRTLLCLKDFSIQKLCLGTWKKREQK